MNVLIICNKPDIGRDASTIVEHIESFATYTDFNIVEFNTIKEHHFINLEDFSMVIIHYSIVVSNSYFLPPRVRLALREYDGLKVMFIQDEYRFVNKTINCINSLGIDVLYTCVPSSEIEKVYSSAAVPDVIKINTLTGYVPSNLELMEGIDNSARDIDVCYRARELPAWLGELGQEKLYIAQGFSKYCQKYNLKTDISCSEQTRLYGNKWIDFLRNSKAALGTESGASVFDFTGEIQLNVEKYKDRKPSASFKEMQDMFFRELEGNIYLNQISPRCFECAATKTMMILFEGDYSGILKPWVHYVPLKKDFSNMNEVVHAIKDEEISKNITLNAYNDLIKSGKYSYKSFVEGFIKVIENHKKIRKSLTLKSNTPILSKKTRENILTTDTRCSRYIQFKLWCLQFVRSIVSLILPKIFKRALKNLYVKIRSQNIDLKDVELENVLHICKEPLHLIDEVQASSGALSKKVLFCINKHKLCSINSKDKLNIESFSSLKSIKVKHKRIKLDLEVCQICLNYVR